MTLHFKNKSWHIVKQYLGGFVFCERFGGEIQFVGFSQRPQVKVVFGVYTRWDVDVELEHLQKVTFQLVPAISKRYAPNDISYGVKVATTRTEFAYQTYISSTVISLRIWQ